MERAGGVAEALGLQSAPRRPDARRCGIPSLPWRSERRRLRLPWGLLRGIPGAFDPHKRYGSLRGPRRGLRLERGQQSPKPLRRRAPRPVSLSLPEPADFMDKCMTRARKLRGSLCEQRAQASDVGAHVPSRLDSLEQRLVALRKPVELGARRARVRGYADPDEASPRDADQSAVGT